MKFIEMTGASLLEIITDDEPEPDDLRQSGVQDDSIVRINQQGDIEVRRADGWDIVGGLIGEFGERIRQQTGLDWA